MKRLLALALLVLSIIPAIAGVIAIERPGFAQHPTGGGGGGNVAFAALHTYYIAPTSTMQGSAPTGWAFGNDANTGTDKTHPWSTVNHTGIVCGDVIIAAPGNYTLDASISNGAPFWANFNTPANCPSTSGGIDGTGGIYFATLLCGGDLSASTTTGCTITGIGNIAGYYSVEFDGATSNWAVSGFYFNGGCTNVNSPGNCSRAMGTRVSGCGSNFSRSHHIALINSIVTNSQNALSINDCGDALGTANASTDYIAAVGNIVEDANKNGDFQGGICVGAIDMVSLGAWDTKTGAHAYQYNNYAINNQSPACVSQFDGEDFYIDCPDCHLFNQLAVFSNNLGYGATRACIAMTYWGNSTVVATFKIYNNTCYHDDVNIGPDNDNGEMNLNTGSVNATWNLSVTNNIAFNDINNSGTGLQQTFAVDMWFNINTVSSFGTAGNENVFYATKQPACPGDCDSSSNTVNWFHQTYPTSTNFYVNPNFRNTSDLLTNHMVVPNCTGFTNTTACMGWNANTSTLTTNSVIYDLTPTCTNCGGKGFQLPSTTCTSTGVAADYPDWLKGVVYLHWNGTSLTENDDLVTKPCGR